MAVPVAEKQVAFPVLLEWASVVPAEQQAVSQMFQPSAFGASVASQRSAVAVAVLGQDKHVDHFQLLSIRGPKQ